MSLNATIPPMIRQGQLIDEISSRIPSDVDGAREKLVYARRAVSMFASEEIHVYRPDGVVYNALTPYDTEGLVD